MSILMTADTVGGVWTYCVDLCNALQAYGAAIHLVTMGDKLKDGQREEIGLLGNVTLYETEYRLEWMEQPWNDVEDCSRFLLDLEEKVHPDIVHLNCYAYGSLAFKAPVVMVAHSDVWSWFSTVKNEMPSGEWGHYYERVKQGLHGSDVVIAPSKASLQLVEKIYGVKTGRVVYNGRDPRLFLERKKEPFVFCMGRIWDDAKNIRLLAEAAPSIRFPVRIAGDNCFDKNSFDAAAIGVEFLGKLSAGQIADKLASAAVYVLPATYEPFGLSALEAALSGCALVLGDIPSLREIWQDAAVYVDTKNAGQLAHTVNRIMENKDRLNALREKAKRRASFFSFEKMAEGYWNIYGQFVNQKLKHIEKETA